MARDCVSPSASRVVLACITGMEHIVSKKQRARRFGWINESTGWELTIKRPAGPIVPAVINDPTSGCAVGLHSTSRDRCTVEYLDCADRGVVQEAAINLCHCRTEKVVRFRGVWWMGARNKGGGNWARLHARFCDSWPREGAKHSRATYRGTWGQRKCWTPLSR